MRWAPMPRSGWPCTPGVLGLAEAFAAPLTSDRPDGLWPTVVVDEHDTALGLAYSDLESLTAALGDGRGVYHSRQPGGVGEGRDVRGHPGAHRGQRRLRP